MDGIQPNVELSVIAVSNIKFFDDEGKHKESIELKVAERLIHDILVKISRRDY